MGLGNRIRSKAGELTGKAKVGLGKATNDPGMVAEGHADQARNNFKLMLERARTFLRRY